jgi:flagellar motor switch protein FliN/FliY
LERRHCGTGACRSRCCCRICTIICPESRADCGTVSDFSAKSVHAETQNDIDFIMDIPVQLTVELGRTKIAIKNLLQLAQGSVVELDGLA